MKVNIWSDIRCPFCYIGKHKFEAALKAFPHKDKVEVIWRSFQLDPSLETQPEMNVFDYFSRSKGIPHAQAEQMHAQVTETGAEVGLKFNFDRAIVANSFNAHRLIQLAKARGRGNEAEEQLFEAHFIGGKNIDDTNTLVQLGLDMGLDEKEVNEVLAGDAFADAVKQDELAAQSLGVRGVPFFVINDQYAVSGAQSPAVFLQVLTQGWEAFEKENTLIQTEGEAEACTTDGNCS